MKRPICVKCNLEFRSEESGVAVVELYLKDQKVYKLWAADLYKCPKCGTKIVSGFSNKPMLTSHNCTEEELRGKIKLWENIGKTVVYSELL